jgi:predicted amidohydrolase YtcJ
VGISKETADPPEGLIDRDIETGEPTGLLYGMGDYLGKAIPPLERDQIELGIKLADRELCALGITSIHDASPRNNLDRWKLIQRWEKDGLLKTRVRMMLGKEGFEEYHRHPFPAQVDENQVSIGGVKTIVHETTGQLSPAQCELNEMILNVHRSELQAVLHAIEGKTIEAACNAVEYALQKSPRSDHRHRIEHCSVCPSSLAKRIASLEMMVVTQPSFIFYNGDRYLRTVPDSNLQHLYPIGTLMKNNVVVAGSSDCPIVPASPLVGIISAISRRTDKGHSILPEEGIPPVEALRMYTEYAATAAFEEKNKGVITPGKLADMVVLNGDPTKLPVDEIKNIQVEMTFINGEVVWDKTS